MKRPIQPENQFFLSNTSIYEDDAEKNLEFFNHGAWTINSIENGKPIRSLSLGDWIEYVDPMLSFTYTKPGSNDMIDGSISLENEERSFYRPAIARVIGISAKEVSLHKEDGSRFLLGNNAKFVNYKSLYTKPLDSNTENKKPKFAIINSKLSFIAIILFILLFTLFIILKIT